MFFARYCRSTLHPSLLLSVFFPGRETAREDKQNVAVILAQELPLGVCYSKVRAFWRWQSPQERYPAVPSLHNTKGLLIAYMLSL